MTSITHYTFCSLLYFVKVVLM